MAGPWEKFQSKPAGPWDKFEKSDEPVYSGSILPFSKDAEGNVSFDSNAGIVGSVKRAVTLPGDVMAGEVDPMSDEGIGRTLEMGAIFSPVNPAIRAGERAIPGVARATKQVKAKVPTAEELKAAGGAGYDAVRDMGVLYKSDAVRDAAVTLRGTLEGDGILENLAPKSFSILKQLENPPANSVATSAGIEAARRGLRNAAKDFSNPTEQLAAKRIIQRLDDFVEAGDPASVVAGPAAAAGKTQAEARANIAASKRSERLISVEDAAELRAAAANSGRNLDNSVRSRIASVLLDPKKSAGFNQEELAALKQVVEGTASRNTLRWVGNFLGGGGGLGTIISGGAGLATGSVVGGPVLGGIAAVGLPAVGVASKSAGNRLTLRALRKADEGVRKRSPLYSKRVKEAPMTPISPEGRAAILRAQGATGQRPGMTEEEYRIFLLEGGA